jgi:hypothetical protein
LAQFLCCACLLTLLFFDGGGQLLAQGCEQCRDNLASTPPAVQEAYRHAIELMIVAAAAVFAGVVAMIRWNRNHGATPVTERAQPVDASKRL